MLDAQLEMSFGQAERFYSRNQRRLSRAQWWFERMRQIVERAADWRPAPPPRPEQIWFPAVNDRLAGQTAGLSAKRERTGERQICE